MKKGLFILNVLALFALVKDVVLKPSITGNVIAGDGLALTNPVSLSIVFIIAVTALDIYFYRKSQLRSG